MRSFEATARRSCAGPNLADGRVERDELIETSAVDVCAHLGMVHDEKQRPTDGREAGGGTEENAQGCVVENGDAIEIDSHVSCSIGDDSCQRVGESRKCGHVDGSGQTENDDVADTRFDDGQAHISIISPIVGRGDGSTR